MYQTVAWLGDIGAGLLGLDHPRGGAVYTVRDGEDFLYIGKTLSWVWPHIRQHLRLDGSLGRAARVEAPHSASWRVEACIFVGERGVNVVERERIRRYRPRLNWTYNCGRPRTAFAQRQFQNRSAIGPSCLELIDHGWPDFDGIPWEVLE
jgi:hypothetical protein